MTNPRRWWFGFWHGLHFANGWCFGDTAEKAKDDALAQFRKWHKSYAKGTYTLTLQQDVSPAVYADFQIDFDAPMVAP